MATFRLPILGGGTVPDGSGNVYPVPYDVEATNGTWRRIVFAFEDSGARDGLAGGFHVPQSYAGSATLIVVWTTATTTGDVVWDLDYRAVGGDDVESFDQAAAQETVTVTDTAPSAAHERLETSVALTDGNFAAGDDVTFEAFRDGADAADTLADKALLFGLFFQFSDV